MPYITRRVLLYVPMLLLLTLVVFLLMRVIPGDPALLILAGTLGEGSFTKQDLANLRRELGTDRPVVVQYTSWIAGLLRGDLGMSLFYRTPIVQEIGPRLPATFELAILAGCVSILLAVPLGTLSAVKQDSLLDYRRGSLPLLESASPSLSLACCWSTSLCGSSTGFHRWAMPCYGKTRG